MPKSIIIKSNTNAIIYDLLEEIKTYPNIRFLFKKINGEKTIVIKCYNYYNKIAKENTKNFYGNYIYLYTCISLLLADLIIEKYETLIANRILYYNYFYFEKRSLKKIANILNLILSSNSPLEKSQEFFLYRKQIILSSILRNFRNTNYIHIDSFVNFSLKEYNEFLEEIVDMIVQLFLSKSTSIEYLNFIIKNIFEDV